MKYYHLIMSSLGLFVLQFGLKHVFQLSGNTVLNDVFVGLQGLLLISYGGLMVGFLWVEAKKPTKVRKTSVQATTKKQQTSIKATHGPADTKEKPWLKAS
jgi:hypothetical protein